MQKVYVETTVVSYLAAPTSRDIVVAGHQQTTRDWWRDAAQRYELVTSQLVMQEANAGDANQAALRRSLLDALPILEITDAAQELAAALVQDGAIPPNAAADALHVAIAAVNGVDYLVTWNCRHLANARMRARIEDTCVDADYAAVLICTPEELFED